MKSHLLHREHAPAGESQSGAGSPGVLTQAKDAVTQTAKDTASTLKSAASETATRARASVEKAATETKEDAAERLGNYSSAIDESARSLEEKDPNIAWLTHQAADRLRTVSEYIRGRDFVALRQDAENLARRHPAAFFGGMFVAGLVAGNLMKASASGSEIGASDDGNSADFNPNARFPETGVMGAEL
jgi:hypothetical protein